MRMGGSHRFRPRGAKRGVSRRLGWGAAIALAFATGAAAEWVHATTSTSSSQAAPAATASSPPLSVERMSATWHGQSVYMLHNEGSSAMQYVNVYSWSESLLPVLYVGAHIPHDLNRISALAHPPYTLQSGQSLWFIGPPDTKGPFTVIWRTEDRTYYASVRETSA